MTVQTNFKGIACMLVATGSFVANDSCMKLALSDSPPLQVLVMRGVAACLWCLPILLMLGYGRQIKLAFHPWVLARSFSEVAAILCFILALGHMPIADLTAIAQITPFIVLLGMWFFFGEVVGAFRLLLIAIGILGAILVAQPGGSAASPYALLGFITAAGAAGRDIITRKVPSNVPALVVTFSTLLSVMTAAAIGSVLFEDMVTPTARHAGLMAVAGIFLMCGHLLIYLAFRLAPARVVAPFNYAFTLWAVIAGYLVFGDVPNTLAIAGMALILLAGLAVILLEGRTRQGDPRVTDP